MESDDIEKIEKISNYVKYLSENLSDSINIINKYSIEVERDIFRDYLYGFEDIIKDFKKLKFLKTVRVSKHIDLENLSIYFKEISEIIKKESLSKSNNVELTREVIYALKDLIDTLENDDTVKRDIKIEKMLNEH